MFKVIHVAYDESRTISFAHSYIPYDFLLVMKASYKFCEFWVVVIHRVGKESFCREDSLLTMDLIGSLESNIK
jgi:hypothetical protein